MLSKMLCWFGNQQYRVHQHFSAETRRVVCDRCLKSWAMNDRISVIVPWSQEFHDFYVERGQQIKPYNPVRRTAVQRGDQYPPY